MFKTRSRGRSTLCTRIETGKSSETPWRSPRTIASGKEISEASNKLLLAGSLGAAAEPGEHEAGEPDEEGRDSVLRVVVARARLVAREEPGQRLCRLGPVDRRDNDQRDPGGDRERDEEPV